MLRSLRHGLRRLVNGNTVERELTDEVQHYLELSAEEHMRRGLSRADAMRAARLDFGGVESAKERVRTGGWEASVESVWRDVRYALRGMARNPVFTLVVTATLALGIGATTAMFSVLNAVMLRPLPYHQPGRLALLWTEDVRRGLRNENTSYATISDWRRDNQTFDTIAFFNLGRVTLGEGDGRERIGTAMVSGNLFPMLGVTPAQGRAITEEEERTGAPVAVISHSLWTRRFASDPDIIGKVLPAEDWQGKEDIAAVTVIGVMAPEFFFPNRITHIWIPATTYWRWSHEASERFQSWARRWTPIGRLRPGITLADARADLARLDERLSSIYRTDIPDFPGFAVNLVPFLDFVAGAPLQQGLWLLMAAVAVVLLVACVNIVNLLLARGVARQHEFAMRRALGASRLRLVRQQLVESVTLATLGGAAGFLLAVWLTRGLTLLAAERLPRLDEGAVDLRVLAFAVLTSLLAAIVIGVFPAVRVTTVERFRPVRSRGVMVAAECALAVLLLVGAGLLLRSLARVYAVAPGFDTSHVLVARVEFPREPPQSPAAQAAMTDVDRAMRREQVQQALLERIQGLPEVEAVAFVDDLFISGQGHASIVFPAIDPATVPAGELAEALASPEFFSTLRVPLRAGRYLRRDDAITKIRALHSPMLRDMPLAEKARRAIAEPVVVNDAFVARFLKGTDPLTQRFCIDPTAKTYCYEIVGVVGDMHRKGRERAAIAEYDGPHLSAAGARADLVVRTRGTPLAVAGVVKDAVFAAVPGALVPRVSSAESDLGDFTAQRTLQTWLLAGFAAVALLLAAIGIYGLVHYAVTQRTREIGIRIAVGARPWDVFTQVMADGLRLPIVGFAIGLVAALGVTRLVAHLLFDVDQFDPMTLLAVTATLLLTSFVACFAPARRAGRIDAIRALRAE